MTVTPYRFHDVDGLLLAEVEVSDEQRGAGIRRRFLVRHSGAVGSRNLAATGSDQFVLARADGSLHCTCGATDLCEHILVVRTWLTPPPSPDRPAATAAAA